MKLKILKNLRTEKFFEIYLDGSFSANFFENSENDVGKKSVLQLYDLVYFFTVFE